MGKKTASGLISLNNAVFREYTNKITLTKRLVSIICALAVVLILVISWTLWFTKYRAVIDSYFEIFNNTTLDPALTIKITFKELSIFSFVLMGGMFLFIVLPLTFIKNKSSFLVLVSLLTFIFAALILISFFILIFTSFNTIKFLIQGNNPNYNTMGDIMIVFLPWGLVLFFVVIILINSITIAISCTMRERVIPEKKEILIRDTEHVVNDNIVIPAVSPPNFANPVPTPVSTPTTSIPITTPINIIVTNNSVPVEPEIHSQQQSHPVAVESEEVINKTNDSLIYNQVVSDPQNIQGAHHDEVVSPTLGSVNQSLSEEAQASNQEPEVTPAIIEEDGTTDFNTKGSGEFATGNIDESENTISSSENQTSFESQPVIFDAPEPEVPLPEIQLESESEEVIKIPDYEIPDYEIPIESQPIMVDSPEPFVVPEPQPAIVKTPEPVPTAAPIPQTEAAQVQEPIIKPVESASSTSEVISKWTEEEIQLVWEKAEKIDPLDNGEIYRKDYAGAWIFRDGFKNSLKDIKKEELYNWTIVLHRPLSQNGTKDLANLDPMNIFNAKSKGEDYPRWKTVLTSNPKRKEATGNQNFEKVIFWKARH